jgi:hypothetical protein
LLHDTKEPRGQDYGAGTMELKAATLQDANAQGDGPDDGGAQAALARSIETVGAPVPRQSIHKFVHCVFSATTANGRAE